MNIPKFAGTHSLLCLTAREDGDYINIETPQGTIAVCIRKARNGRASVAIVAPRVFNISRVKTGDADLMGNRIL